jgi:hypothetical protein
VVPVGSRRSALHHQRAQFFLQFCFVSAKGVAFIGFLSNLRPMVAYLPPNHRGRPPTSISSQSQRARAQAAFQLARKLDPDNAGYFGAVYASALEAAQKADSRVGEVAWRRAAILLEVACDRVNWPHSLMGL